MRAIIFMREGARKITTRVQGLQRGKSIPLRAWWRISCRNDSPGFVADFSMRDRGRADNRSHDRAFDGKHRRLRVAGRAALSAAGLRPPLAAVGVKGS